MKKLTPEQTGYIRDNISKRSAKEISKTLGLEYRLVADYIKNMPVGNFSTGKPAVLISPFLMTATHIATIFIVALTLRLIYVHQLSQSYFFAPFKGGFDDYIFDSWAMDILKGNWLGDSVIYIYRMPLYVYFLSFVYYLFGHSYLAVYILQSIMGAMTCVIVYRIGRIYFTPAAGFAAGLLSAFYGPFLYYTGMLVGETIGIFLTCLSFLFLLYFQNSRKYIHLLLAGILVGFSMLARGNMLVVMPFIVTWIICMLWKDGPGKIFISVIMLLLGTIFAISPIMIRNYVNEKDIVPITALGGLNIYIGNVYGADGKYHIVPKVGNSAENMIRDSIIVAEQEAGRKLKPSEVSNFWLKETLNSIHEHGPWYLLPLTVKKFVLFWNSYELPDIWDYYFIRNYIPILQFPFINFAVLAALACAGIVFSWDRRRELMLLFFFITGYMVSLIMVFITSRYRMQIIPFLSIPAGYALVCFVNAKKSGVGKAGYGFAVMILAFVFCNIPIEKVSFETSYNSLGVLMKREGRFDDAIQIYKKAIDIAPAYPSPYYNLGILYRDMGRDKEAVSYFQKALEVAPDFKQARERLEELG